jgi:hypothetical protein
VVRSLRRFADAEMPAEIKLGASFRFLPSSFFSTLMSLSTHFFPQKRRPGVSEAVYEKRQVSYEI